MGERPSERVLTYSWNWLGPTGKCYPGTNEFSGYIQSLHQLHEPFMKKCYLANLS